MSHEERMAKLYTQPCAQCGCGLNNQQAISPNLAFWEHLTERDCIRALRIETERAGGTR